MTILRWMARPSVAFGWALALLLPLQILFVVSNEWFYRPPKPQGDGPEYENIAFHLAQGQGFRVRNKDPQWRAIYEATPSEYAAQLDAAPRDLMTTGRPPLFPSCVALVYSTIGRTPQGFGSVRFLSACCLALAGALSAALCAACCRFIYHRKTAPLESWSTVLPTLMGIGFTVFLAGSNRTLQSYANDFLTEPLALLMTQCFAVAVIASFGAPDSGKKTRLLLLSGLLLGFMVLTRSIFVVWLPCIGIILCLAESNWQTALRSLMYLGCTCLIICLPWWIRNMYVLGEPMPLGTQGPITLLGGYSDAAAAAGGEWQYEPEQSLRRDMSNTAELLNAKDDTAREVMISRAASHKVRVWIVANWRELPQMAVHRIITHWNPYRGPSLVWKLTALAGVVSMFLGIRRKQSDLVRYGTWMLGLPLVSTLVVAALYSTGGRFLVPMYGILFALAGIGVASICGLCWQAVASNYPPSKLRGASS